MRLQTGWPIAILLSLAGCLDDEPVAVLDYSVADAAPSVPLAALQVFDIDAAGNSNGSIAMSWGDVIPLPSSGSISYHGDLPPTLRLCAVGLGTGDELLHALSEPIRLAFEQRISVELTLEVVEPGGEVPEPCGPEVDPWPDGV